MSLNKFKLFSKVSRFLIFVFCCAFVATRGYKCIEKFIQKPEGVEISYHFNGNLDFPSISFCPAVENLDDETLLPQPYNKEVLKSCNLTIFEYVFNGQWIGKKGICNDPKSLHEKLMPTLEAMGLLYIKISFANKGNKNKTYTLQ